MNVKTRYVIYSKNDKKSYNLTDNDFLFPIRDFCDENTFISTVLPLHFLNQKYLPDNYKILNDFAANNKFTEDSTQLLYYGN
jgi:hypothetical protein